ncbi:MAG TPA: transcription-repair coupling factor [Gammaproteobacteria bacterium]|nr:transcription-repair coupling factor [Gammaproteobacteria bacterium]
MSSTSRALLSLEVPTAERPRIVWRGLHGAAGSLAIAEAVAAARGTVAVVTRTAAAAEQLRRELDFFAPGIEVALFPDYETLPYEPISPPRDLLADRLAALYLLATGEPVRLIVNAGALLGRLPPPAFVVSRSLELAKGQEIDRDRLTASMIEHGYFRVSQVAEPGEIAIRGAVIDIFPAGARRAVRIDLFDREIESLRLFDPETQIADTDQDRISVLPAREFPFDADAIRSFRQRFREAFPVEPGRCPVYRDISDAQLPAGIEYYLPLFFDETVSLFDYLPGDGLVIVLGDALDGLVDAGELIGQRYEQLRHDAERPVLGPHEAFVAPQDIVQSLGARRTIRLTNDPGAADGDVVDIETSHPLSGGVVDDIDRIRRWIEAPGGTRSLLLASSPGRREVLLELLRGRAYHAVAARSWQDFLDHDDALMVAAGELEQGLNLPARGIRIVTAEQLGLERPRQQARRRRRARDPEAIIRELTDLSIGAPVVHEHHGIGRYQGLKTLEVDGTATEFLLLEYADSDKLYVPVLSLHLVTRYTGASPDEAPLHRLGSDQWQKAKRKAAREARDVAAELLNLYAQRAAREGTRIAGIDDDYRRFAAQFPFEETDDQQAAINDVFADLASGKPMDRVVCGDVGFGKTEVALRAAFIAVEAGHQVAVLVPTTLLAQQHHQTFADRFSDWPVEVEYLSRFRGRKDAAHVVDRIAGGAVDIVIGTHRLLSGDIRFRNLGLVVIDEEHRFGVKHKEILKRYRADVHVLTMTATPIPRTLNMTLGSLRDLSIIATPPADRLSIRTFVGEWSDQGIREAVLREVRRGGQVYVVHNRVENIEAIAERLRDLLPETEIRVAHGQMSERELETVMLDFYHRRFAVLLCTTIIESGIDVATANTIVINRADRLGLAQLHQLRGRVGRSHHQAYAYMLTPPRRAMTDDAAKRLDAVASLEALGSGFALATHDLEIRGAGELLGEGQSGQIQAIGFTLYNELLARAVASLRAGREPALDDPFRHGPEVETGLPVLIPEHYMPDVYMRLVQYKRIANAATREELEDLEVEMINRFGLLEAPTKALFGVTWIKLLAAELRVEKLDAGPKGGSIRFSKDASVDPEALVRLVGDGYGGYSLDGPYRLRFRWDPPVPAEARLERLERLLIRLGAEPPDAARVA